MKSGTIKWLEKHKSKIEAMLNIKKTDVHLVPYICIEAGTEQHTVRCCVKEPVDPRNCSSGIIINAKNITILLAMNTPILEEDGAILNQENNDMDLLFVLAHELRHIYQLAAGRGKGCNPESLAEHVSNSEEIDADAFAMAYMLSEGIDLNKELGKATRAMLLYELENDAGKRKDRLQQIINDDFGIQKEVKTGKQ